MARLLPIVQIHGAVDTLQAERRDDFGGEFEAVGQQFLLLVGPFAEHEVALCSASEVVAYTEANSGVVLRAEYGLYVAQAVVPAVATLLADTDSTERKVEVVHQDEHVLHGDFLLLQPIAHGVAAEVHIGAWLEQDHLRILHAALRHKAIALVRPLYVLGFGKGIEHHEADVVARGGILIADISKTYD